MKRTVSRYFLALTMLIVIEGCSTFTVTSSQTPKTDDIKSKVVVGLLWGVIDPDIKADCEGHGLEFVSTQTNFFYGLCTVATLGIVTPMTVNYRCAGTPLIEGTPFGQ